MEQLADHASARTPPSTAAQALRAVRHFVAEHAQLAAFTGLASLARRSQWTRSMKPATRILIVDDEANSRNALAELLHDEGYEVATASDGVAARARIAELRPDSVLSDVHMPGFDDSGLFESAAGGDRPALVLMSARPQPRDAVVPFVRKPIELDELVTTIEDTLAGR